MATFSEKRRFMRNWYLFVRPLRDLLLHREVIARLRDGTALVLRGTRSSDFFAMGSVIFDDVYRVGKIKDPKVILDVGANIGTFTVLVARKFPQAKVIAVEPEPENVARLKKNIALNGLANVEVRECAVSATQGTATLYLRQDHPSAHSLYQDSQHGGGASITVETVPLSAFGKIDAIKIDCEGAEVSILDGNIPDCRYVAVEFDTDDKDRIVKQFTERGYRVEEAKEGNCIFTRE